MSVGTARHLLRSEPPMIAIRYSYIEDRLGELARLIQRSRAIGATHFCWG
jgi:hypothetical protein